MIFRRVLLFSWQFPPASIVTKEIPEKQQLHSLLSLFCRSIHYPPHPLPLNQQLLSSHQTSPTSSAPLPHSPPVSECKWSRRCGLRSLPRGWQIQGVASECATSCRCCLATST